MTNIAKRALGLASALVFMGAMALVASPVQAADVDTRIAALERELAQLKQSQDVANEERALAAEMKGPSFKYSAGKGLTIAAADNNWSITFGQRLQIYSSYWLSNDDPAGGFNHGVIRIRRFRPSINVTSQQGFYEVKWTFSGKDTVAFDGDIYLHFEKMNPYLPTVGYGYNPSFGANKVQGYGRTEDSPMINAMAMGGSQDRSLVLAWKKLPNMGAVKVTHLEVAIGYDQLDEYGRSPGIESDGKSMGFALGVKPLAGAGTQGGINVGSFAYNFGYERMRDNYGGVSASNIYGPTTQERIKILDAGSVTGDHDYAVHGVRWDPMKWLGIGINYANYKGTNEGSATSDIKLNEFRAAAIIWLWGPKNGVLSGSKSEGGISVSPLYTIIDAKKIGGEKADAEAKNHGLAVVYNAPGGWFQVHGVWDNLGCDGVDCPDIKTADEGKDSASVFTLIAEYRF